MGILFGGIAALCWGVGDYLIAVVTRRVGTTRAMALTQSFSLIAWFGLLLVWPSTPSASPGIWALAAVSGACYVVAMWLSYRAFEIGSLAVISPIASGFVVVTALLGMISGERLTSAKLLGATALFLGVILVTRPPNAESNTTREGIPHALGAALAFGIMFWMLGYITPESKLGHVWPLIVLKVIASGLMWLLLVFQKTPVPDKADASTPIESTPVLSAADLPASPPEQITTSPITTARAVWAAVGFALLDTTAWVAYIIGTRTEFTTVVTAVASLFSAVAVLLGWAVLRERLAPNQWAGIAVILLGVLLVSI